jgi:hypothetical protein
MNYIADIHHVISRWYNDPRYLDAQGAPRALPMWAEGPSLSELIARIFPREDPSAVVESLIKLGSVRRRGDLFEPVTRHCILTGDSARLHAVSTLSGFLSTVHHNVGRGEPKLFERTVSNPSFPVSALPAFYRRLTEVIDEQLKALDTEMQSFEESVTEGPRVRLAVGIFAFENPEGRHAAEDGEGGDRVVKAQAGRRKGERGERG